MNVMDAIRTRRSVRSYATDPLSPEVRKRMRDALRLAPSACNFQPWHFILVSEAGKRRALAAASNSQNWMADAPLIVVGCAVPDQAYQRMGGYGNSADLDVTIALDHLTLAAVAEGLGTCWIGAFDEGQVKALLNVPEEVKVVAMTPLGYPASPDLIRPLEPGKRKDESAIFSADRYGHPLPGETG